MADQHKNIGKNKQVYDILLTLCNPADSEVI